jgi:type II secretory pathway pseudopilin PulG
MRLKRFSAGRGGKFPNLPIGVVGRGGKFPNLPIDYRRGLTLVEVVFSLAIFLFSLTAVSQLLSLSGANVMDASARSRSALLCQSKMAEVLAGVESVEGSGGGYAPFNTGDGSSNEGFEWRMSSTPDDSLPGLYHVQVYVRKEVPGRGYVEVSLGQMVVDPGKKGSTLDNPVPASAASN